MLGIFQLAFTKPSPQAWRAGASGYHVTKEDREAQGGQVACRKSQGILATASWGSQRGPAQPQLTRGWSSESSEFNKQEENGIEGPLSDMEHRPLCWQGLRTKGYRLKPWAC